MDKSSLFKLSGLPDTFGVVLLSFSFVLLLAPYFSGADFGVFKVPLFTTPAKKWLKILGPVLFGFFVFSFLPILSVTKSPSTAMNNGANATEKPSPTSTRSLSQANTSQFPPSSETSSSLPKLTGLDCKYEKRDLTYVFVNGRSEYKPVIREALKIWADASRIEFREISEAKSADLKFSWEQSEHGDATPLTLKPLEPPFVHSFFPPPCGGDRAGEIHFNDATLWALKPGQLGISLKVVALYAVGNALSLPKSTSSDSVMYPVYRPEVDTLSKDDIAKVRELYGEP